MLIKGKYDDTQVYYFHKWVEQPIVKRHPEDPTKDRIAIMTFALIENIESGITDLWDADCIKFIS